MVFVTTVKSVRLQIIKADDQKVEEAKRRTF
jgi:hypothetical protein